MEETLADKLLQKDAFTPVRRFTIGVLLAASMSLGIPALLATSAASYFINKSVFGLERRAQQKKLLSFYKEEIAALMHKLPADLTLEDLKQAAAPVEQGGKGIAFLRKELEDFDTSRKFRLNYSAVSSVITTGSLIAMTLLSPVFLTGTLGLVLGLGLVGLGHAVVSQTVRAVGDATFGNKDPENTVNQRLMRLAEDVKHKPVSPMEVFDLFVESNTSLQKQIREQFGKPYADLTVLQKKQAADILEPDYRVISLTNEINKGTIMPSSVGFISAGLSFPEMPDFSAYQALSQKPLPQISNAVFEGDHSESISRTHVERILKERAENSNPQFSSPLIH